MNRILPGSIQPSLSHYSLKKLKIRQHWLDCANRIPSPNYDDRPDENDISLIVIHCISLPPGEFGGNYINQLFCNELKPCGHEYFEAIHELKVSAHFLINRNGIISQFVPLNKRAWHAGPSEYNGKKSCNDFSIGIELEGTETQPYTTQQYTSLAQLIKSLIGSYPQLSIKQITGHSHIAPGRKIDPGDSFEWETLMKLLEE